MLSRCPHCEKSIVVPEPGIHTCPQCRARIWLYPPGSDKEDRVLLSPSAQASPSRRASRPAPPPPWRELESFQKGGDGNMTAPWEERGERGFMDALVSTWRLVCFHPTLFFTRLNALAPLRGVAFFGWLMLTLGYMFWSIYRLLFLPVVIEATYKAAGTQPGIPDEARLHLLIILVLVATPLLSLASLWLNALMYHAVLMLLDVPLRAFAGTFRVVAYGSAPILLLLFPLFGEFVAFIWSMVVSVIGLSCVHRLSTPRSMLAVLLPPLAFYLLILLAAKVMESLAIAPYILP